MSGRSTAPSLPDPRSAHAFRFVRCGYADGVAELAYAFDGGPELVETVRFPGAPTVAPERQGAFAAALDMLHLIAGVSYYKAGVPARVEIATGALDADTAALLDVLYIDGLAEFAYRNGLDLAGRRLFAGSAAATSAAGAAPRLGLPARALVPLGGGKDSLVVVEALKAQAADASVAWIGASQLIAGVARRTGLPAFNIARELSPVLFDYNHAGAWNGHVPVTAINSAILACAALLYGFDAIVFANERSASAATLEYRGHAVNHQWSKGWSFESAFAAWLRRHVAADLDYFSLLRPFPELAVTRAFARVGTAYFGAFSSCNRNFRILGPKPADHWCGQCPKCHFVFLALAPFVPKPRLLTIFGRNLLDDEALAPGFDALIEYREHKPFECVGEASEARAALATLAARPEWREDALVARFREEIAPQLGSADLALEPWLTPSGKHGVPTRFADALTWIGA
ncbi:MAG TPA: UDP-N-acetyl-alpha-D-muramoyl-L-alanyl-L-glutamate epimerase [Rhodanobacteraceae bacterium]|nr:UDP-N-acetyl-alpha-D-muramoyl-L-alanyl-L-glutamate epimerase [Rhodanobacteraceae bacterium]